MKRDLLELSFKLSEGETGELRFSGSVKLGDELRAVANNFFGMYLQDNSSNTNEDIERQKTTAEYKEILK